VAEEDLFTRTFRIPPGFAATLGAGADGGEVPHHGVAQEGGHRVPRKKFGEIGC
jgi:hypothetical protein